MIVSVLSAIFHNERKRLLDVWIFVFCHLSHLDDSVTTGGAQPCHDVETLPDQTFITSTQSTLSNGTFVYFPGKRRGHSGVQVMQGD